jgi:uncharacterized protein
MTARYRAPVEGPQSNLDLLRHAYDALGRGEPTPFLELLSEDAVLTVPGTSPRSGVHGGKEAVIHHYLHGAQLTGGTISIVPLELTGWGDFVVAYQRIAAQREGRRLDQEMCVVFRVRNGEVVEICDHMADQAAADAFWED